MRGVNVDAMHDWTATGLRKWALQIAPNNKFDSKRLAPGLPGSCGDLVALGPKHATRKVRALGSISHFLECCLGVCVCEKGVASRVKDSRCLRKHFR